MFQMTDLSSNPYFDHCNEDILECNGTVRSSACHVVDECFVVDFVFNVLIALLLLVTSEV